MDLGAVASMLGGAAMGAGKAIGKGAMAIGGAMKENYKNASPEMKAVMFEKFADMAMGGMDGGFYKHMDGSKMPRQPIFGGQNGPLKKGK